MRVSTQMVSRNLSFNMNEVSTRLYRLQEQISSGYRINRPSDDPAGAARAAALRTTTSELACYQENAESGLSLLKATDSALSEIADVLRTAYTTGLSGANDTTSDGDRTVLSKQIDGILDSVISAGNRDLAGTFIFGGFKTTTAPFALDTGGSSVATFSGDQGARLFQVGRDVSITVNITGDQVFNMNGSVDPTTSDTFTALANLRDALASGDAIAIQTSTDAIQTHLTHIISLRGELGVREQSAELAVSRLTASQLSIKDTLSSTENTDVTEALVSLQAQENAYQATLNAASILSRPGLWSVLS
jgi:flagellar hook-associated protein 3 FlgL